jgi:hypothetical protein
MRRYGEALKADVSANATEPGQNLSKAGHSRSRHLELEEVLAAAESVPAS